MLGNPVEVYLYGTQYMTIILAFIPMTAALLYIYVPVYFRLQLTSAYEVNVLFIKYIFIHEHNNMPKLWNTSENIIKLFSCF